MSVYENLPAENLLSKVFGREPFNTKVLPKKLLRRSFSKDISIKVLSAELLLINAFPQRTFCNGLSAELPPARVFGREPFKKVFSKDDLNKKMF